MCDVGVTYAISDFKNKTKQKLKHTERLKLIKEGY